MKKAISFFRSFPKAVWIIAGVALLLKACYLFFALSANEHAIWLPDSSGYHQIGYNLFNYGAFSQSPYPDQLLPDSMRTPVYPALIAFLLWLQWPLTLLIVAQVVLSVLPVLLVYKLCEREKLHQNISLWAAAFMALDIPTLFFSTTLMTDSLFQVLIVMGFYLFVTAKGHPRLLWAAVVFGLATLLRPVGFLVPLVLLFFNRWSKTGRIKLKTASIFLLIYLLFPISWMVRNQQTFDKAFLSSVAEVNLFYHFTKPLLENEQEKAKWQATYQTFTSTEDTIPISTFIEMSRGQAKDAVLNHPLKAAYQALKNVVLVLIKPMKSYFSYQLYPDQFNWNDKPLSGKLFGGNTFSLVMVWLQLLQIGLLLIGVIRMNYRSVAILCATGVMIYFMLAAGISVPDARFRVAFIPLFIFTAASGWNRWIKKHEQTTKKTSG